MCYGGMQPVIWIQLFGHWTSNGLSYFNKGLNFQAKTSFEAYFTLFQWDLGTLDSIDLLLPFMLVLSYSNQMWDVLNL